MLMQFRSARPMNDGNYLLVLTSDFRRLPLIIQGYDLVGMDLSTWSNIDQISIEVERQGYTFGIREPAEPSENRLAFTHLRTMIGQD